MTSLYFAYYYFYNYDNNKDKMKFSIYLCLQKHTLLSTILLNIQKNNKQLFITLIIIYICNTYKHIINI